MDYLFFDTHCIVLVSTGFFLKFIYFIFLNFLKILMVSDKPIHKHFRIHESQSKPITKFVIFTIYRSYTLALTCEILNCTLVFQPRLCDLQSASSSWRPQTPRAQGRHLRQAHQPGSQPAQVPEVSAGDGRGALWTPLRRSSCSQQLLDCRRLYLQVLWGEDMFFLGWPRVEHCGVVVCTLSSYCPSERNGSVPAPKNRMSVPTNSEIFTFISPPAVFWW